MRVIDKVTWKADGSGFTYDLGLATDEVLVAVKAGSRVIEPDAPLFKEAGWKTGFFDRDVQIIPAPPSDEERRFGDWFARNYDMGFDSLRPAARAAWLARAAEGE